MKKRFFAGRLIALILCARLLTGCNAETGTAGSDNQNTADNNNSSVPEICNTLSEVEVTSLLNSLYESMPVEMIQAGADGCKYMATVEENGLAKNINFIVRRTNDESQSKDEFYRAVNVWQNSALENRAYEYIDGIGTGAFVAYAEKTPQLIAYKGKVLVILTFGNFYEDKDVMVEKMKALALKLLDRLQI